jgi:tRNA nucleotidyltransferase (CCA-adding enzyme)
MNLFQNIPELRQIAAQLPPQTYLVGGAVRDLILNRPILDLDLVVEANAIQLAQRLQQQYGGTVTLHTRFATATWQPPTGPALDLITARRETYPTPAALPQITPSTLADDLARRDFSINTLALSLSDNSLIDLHHGQADLKNGLIRVLHPQSFCDDPTRLYRAVRYETRYNFQIAPETLALIPPALPLVERLTPERIRHEFDLLFHELHPAKALVRMDQLGLLQAVLPDVLPWDSDTADRLSSGLAALPAPGWGLDLTFNGQPLKVVLGYALWLGNLHYAQIDLLHERLNFPLAVLKTIQAVSALTADLPALTDARPSAWVRRLTEVPLPALYAMHIFSREPALERYVSTWRHIHPAADGETLKALGLPPGPRYAHILATLRAAWLDGEINTPEQESGFLQKLIQQKG